MTLKGVGGKFGKGVRGGYGELKSWSMVSKLLIVVVVMAFLLGFAARGGQFSILKPNSIARITAANIQPSYNLVQYPGFGWGWTPQGTWAVSSVGAKPSLIDSVNYGSSFYNQGSSESMVASLQFTNPTSGGSPNGPSQVLYEFWFNSASGPYPANYTVTATAPSPMASGQNYGPPGSGFVLIKQDVKSVGSAPFSSTMTAPPSAMAVFGNYIGVVHVRVYAHFTCTNVNNPFQCLGSPLDYGWIDVADQEANVEPGFGYVTVNNADSYGNVVLQVGDTLSVTTQTGVSCSAKPVSQQPSPGFSTNCGWLLTIRQWGWGSGASPQGWTDKLVPDFSTQTYTVKVLPSWWKNGTTSVYKVDLFNSFDLQDWTLFATVDNRSLAPIMRSVTTSPPGPYSIGQTVTINATAQSNPTTKLAIVSFSFLVTQGSKVLLASNTSATPAGSGLYSASAYFTVYTDKIPVKEQVFAWDGSRSSVYQPQFLVVKNANYNNNPPCPTGWTGLYPNCVPPIIPGWTIWMAVLFVGFMVLGVAAAAPQALKREGGGEMPLGAVRMAGAVIGIALIGVAIFMLIPYAMLVAAGGTLPRW